MPKEKAPKEKKESKRAPTPYNKFMADNLPKIKAKHPDLSHKDAFRKVADLWATSPENPKNKK